MESPEGPVIPSWMKWPPNCCETCTGWIRSEQWVGKCNDSDSLLVGETTDARFRCPTFKRKPDAKHEKPSV